MHYDWEEHKETRMALYNFKISRQETEAGVFKAREFSENIKQSNNSRGGWKEERENWKKEGWKECNYFTVIIQEVLTPSKSYRVHIHINKYVLTYLSIPNEEDLALNQ